MLIKDSKFEKKRMAIPKFTNIESTNLKKKKTVYVFIFLLKSYMIYRKLRFAL